jgi:hypothetical protein
MTPAQYARYARVHRATVGRWIKSGRLTLKNGLIDAQEADSALKATSIGLQPFRIEEWPRLNDADIKRLFPADPMR